MLILQSQNRALLGLALLIILLLAGAAAAWYRAELAPKPPPAGARLVWQTGAAGV
ncbi:MAG: hypothetical protein ACOY93_19370 [Bacillota bacterium]